MEHMVLSGLVALGMGIICGSLGVYIATQKGRNEWEGLLFGFLLGPFGVIIEALLPEQEPSERPERNTKGHYRMPKKFYEGPADEDWRDIQSRMR